MWFVIILGIIAFLLFEHALVFWIVFVPLMLLLIVSIVKFFKGSTSGVTDLATSITIFIGMILILVIVCIP